MALKISLKPHECLIMGGSDITIIRNGENSNDLIIENKIPILIRGKDIMLEKDATSPCKKIYFVIQLMYLDRNNLSEYHRIYWKFVHDILEAAPSTLGFLDNISEHILCERYYQALKVTRQLIDYEQLLMKHAKNSQNNPDNYNLIAPV
jgi:flagellar protein FlbT